MRYCGIELKSNEAILVGIETTQNEYRLVSESVGKIKLSDPDDQLSVQEFSKQLSAYFDLHQFDGISIKARGKKGRFAGGPTSFKIEGIIQNCSYPVELIHIATVKSKIKGKEPEPGKVLAYQLDALRVAISMI